MESRAYWACILPDPSNAVWQDEVHRVVTEAEPRHALADYDTGSILESEAYLLRALAEFLKARVVIDVGTFIGTSAGALASASTVRDVYTCDISNDCLPSAGAIETFPKTSSTVMLAELARRGIRADLCFFDGVLRDEDVRLLAYVTAPGVVFAVHDYNYGPKIRKSGALETVPRKGIGNIRALQTVWKSYIVMDPLPETTVALFVPESRL